MENKTCKKYFIEIECGNLYIKFYLGLNKKTDKFVWRNGRRAKSCITFDTLEAADNFIIENQQYFIDDRDISSVGAIQYETKVAHYEYF